MTDGFLIVIADETGAELERTFLREQYGAKALTDTIATDVARFRGEIFAADQITITVTREHLADLAPLPVGAGDDDGDLPL